MLCSKTDLLPCPSPQSCQHNPQFLMEFSRSVVLNTSSTLASTEKLKTNNPQNAQNRGSSPSPGQKRNLRGAEMKTGEAPACIIFQAHLSYIRAPGKHLLAIHCMSHADLGTEATAVKKQIKTSALRLAIFWQRGFLSISPVP